MATRVVEGKKPYTGGKAIDIDENKVISLRLREENNLIIWDEGDNEIYVDLQLPDGIEPLDAFPVGVNVGRVLIADDWDVNGTLVVFKTTSGDNIKLLYGDDGKLYIDNGTGLFKQIYLKGEVDALLQALRDYVDAQLALKQDKLIAGDYIEIDDNVISAVIPTMSRFLSIWNASTGQPISFPASVPFTYHTGDYYLVENVDTVNNPPVNYRPDGYEYTGDVSHTLETDLEIADGDVYIFDGSVWLLQENHNKTVAFANIAGDPYDNTNLSTALNAKANTTDVLTKTNTTSYTPSGNYNPATKKYVDDGLSNKQATLVSGTNIKSINSNSLLGSGNLSISEVPSGGTNGQVLTQTSQGPAWQNATGGADIEYKTQAEYNALLPGAASDGKHYFIYTPSVVPPTPPFTPGVDTLVYCPLNGDVKNYATNTDMNDTGISFSTVGDFQVGYFNQKYLYTSVADVSDLTGELTYNIRFKQTTQNNLDIIAVGQQSNYKSRTLQASRNSSNSYFRLSGWYADTDSASGSLVDNTWLNVAVTIKSGEVKIYVNGVQSGNTGTPSFNTFTNTGINICAEINGQSQARDVYLSNVIIEKKIWTAQEVSDYFDLTKGDYGIS